MSTKRRKHKASSSSDHDDDYISDRDTKQEELSVEESSLPQKDSGNSSSEQSYSESQSSEEQHKKKQKKPVKSSSKRKVSKKKVVETDSEESDESSEQDYSEESVKKKRKHREPIDESNSKGKKGSEVKSGDDDKHKAPDQSTLLVPVYDFLKSENITSENHFETGLTADQAAERLEKFGPNALPEYSESPILKFLSFMWNPLAWVMEIAAIISIVLIDYVDFLLILFLLIVNSTIAFWEEYSSGEAIAALKNQLTPNCKCIRDGVMNREMKSSELVPGDVILLKFGDVVPADAFILEGEGLKIDQAALTGESLPVKKYTGEVALSGSIVNQGEQLGVVKCTGVNTFFGEAAALVQKASGTVGHVQIVLASIGWFCIVVIGIGVLGELIVQFTAYNARCHGVGPGKCEVLNNMLVMVVGGVPIAMPTVLSVTMAIGAQKLAKKEALVTRLTAVEELAGMDILCSDKTGTLTKNKLTIAEPLAYEDFEPSDVIYIAALAAQTDGGDAIDLAVVNFCSPEQQAERLKHKTIRWFPFDPVSKKTVAKLRTPDGKVIHCAKGAPQVIYNESINKDELGDQPQRDIDRLGAGGYRSLGVSISDEDGVDWRMAGIVPMFDPPRDDTAETIRACNDLGVMVKMITGDHRIIAVETARLLGMGTNIQPATILKETGIDIPALCEHADGFAQVYPSDKYDIVKNLQGLKHVCGMTGDGVNDAPALKQADIGIAVADATDAARAASDIVLLSAGLRVIEDAIIGARKIFQRMKNYCMYSISMCMRVVLTFGLLSVCWNWYYPTIAVVFLAIINDGTMLSISKDRVLPSPTPDEWNLKEIYGIALVLGSYLSLSTLAYFSIAKDSNFFHTAFDLRELSNSHLRGLIYMQVSISGLSTIFVTRSVSWSYCERPAYIVGFGFLGAQTVASFLGAYGLGGYPHVYEDDRSNSPDWNGAGWGYVVLTWVWCMIWYLLMDPIKFVVRGVAKGAYFRSDRANKRRLAEKGGVVIPRPAEHRPSISKDPHAKPEVPKAKEAPKAKEVPKEKGSSKPKEVVGEAKREAVNRKSLDIKPKAAEKKQPDKPVKGKK